MFHYSVACREKPFPYNVLSLEQKAAVNNIICSDDIMEMYRIARCEEPKKTQLDAAMLAINGRATLELELYKALVPSGLGCGWKPAVFAYSPEQGAKPRRGLGVRCGHVLYSHSNWEVVGLCKDCVKNLY